jgi:hypothetical protein
LATTAAQVFTADQIGRTMRDMRVHQMLSGASARTRAMRLLIVGLLSAPLVLVSPLSAAAAESDVTLTLDEAAFLSSAPIVTTETFEEFPIPTEYPPTQHRVVIQSVRYRSIEHTSPSWVIDLDPAADTAPDSVLFRRFNSGAGAVGRLRVAIAFRDGGSVDALGFRLEPFAQLSPNAFELIVTEANGDTTSFLLPRDIDDTYIGLSSPNRIKRVLVTQHSELTGGIVNFAFDDVSRGRIFPAA